MRRKYYLVWIRVKQRDVYAIWSSVEAEGEESVFPGDLGEDRLLIDDTGCLKCFSAVRTAKQFAAAAGIPTVEESLTPHDLDQIERFIENEDERTVQSGEYLNAWNLYVDLAVSVNDLAFLDVVDANLDIYDKLFEGTDVPAHHKALSVSWQPDELVRLREVLSLGQKALTARLTD